MHAYEYNECVCVHTSVCVYLFRDLFREVSMYISIFWGDFHLPIKFMPEATVSGDTLCLTVVSVYTYTSTSVIYCFLG